MRLALIAFFALALAVSLTTGTAHADDLVWGSAYKNPWSSWDAYSYKRVESQVRDKTRAALSKSGDPAGAKVVHRPLSASDFKRAKGKRRPVLDEYIAATGLPADQASELRVVLEATLKEIESQVRNNNVATSMGVLIAAATYVVNGVELDDPTQDKLVAALNDVIVADPGFKKLKAKDRQRLSDTLLVQASLIMVMVASGQQDPTAKQTAETAARSSLLFLTGSETGVATAP